MKTDPLFYRLFQERPDTAFELIEQSIPQGCRYRLRAEELEQTAQRLDGILLPECERGDAPLVFTEAQFYKDQDFYRRWFSAIFLYIHRQKVTGHWWALVVYPDHATDIGQTAPFEGLIQTGQLHRVYLEDLVEDNGSAPTAGLTLGQRLARLVVLEQDQSTSEARVLIETLAGDSAEKARLLDLIETIMVYKLSQLSREDIEAMLHLPPTNDLTQTRFYQDAYRDGELKGEERGEERGEKRGEKEGQKRLVLRQLHRRFGELGAIQEKAIAALSTARLEGLADALLDFASMADLDAWLAAQENTPGE